MTPRDPTPAARAGGPSRPRAGDPSPTAGRKPGPYVRRAIAACVSGYLGAIVAAIALLYAGGDRGWLSIFLLFGPRWLLALPLLVLAPLAVATRRRLLWPLLLAAILLIGPVLGFCVPWSRASLSAGHPLRVLTCNLNADSSAARSVGALAREFQPDVVAFQEIPRRAGFEWLDGWNVVRQGELLVASPYRLREIRANTALHPPHKWPRVSLLHCIIETPNGEVNFCNVHLPSPRYGISEVLDRTTVIDLSRRATLLAEVRTRQEASGRAAQWVGSLRGSVLVVGDFNMPLESTIYRRDWSRYRDAFSQSGLGLGWTERPDIQAIRWVPYGVRIDHILMGTGWRSNRAWVGPDVGSDHLPLLANLVRIQ